MNSIENACVFYFQKMIEGIEATITEMLTPLLEMEGFELVAVEIVGRRKNEILRLLLHKVGGLSVSDCQAVARTVRPILEVHQILTRYSHLEIASPGVDRPLKTAADFRRNLGRTVHIEAVSPTGQMFESEGQVTDVVDGFLILEQASGETVQIDISQVRIGRIQLRW